MKRRHEQQLIPIQQKIQCMQDTLGIIDLTADSDEASNDDDDGGDASDNIPASAPDLPLIEYPGNANFRINVSQIRSIVLNRVL